MTDVCATMDPGAAIYAILTALIVFAYYIEMKTRQGGQRFNKARAGGLKKLDEMISG